MKIWRSSGTVATHSKLIMLSNVKLQKLSTVKECNDFSLFLWFQIQVLKKSTSKKIKRLSLFIKEPIFRHTI